MLVLPVHNNVTTQIRRCPHYRVLNSWQQHRRRLQPCWQWPPPQRQSVLRTTWRRKEPRTTRPISFVFRRACTSVPNPREKRPNSARNASQNASKSARRPSSNSWSGHQWLNKRRMWLEAPGQKILRYYVLHDEKVVVLLWYTCYRYNPGYVAYYLSWALLRPKLYLAQWHFYATKHYRDVSLVTAGSLYTYHRSRFASRRYPHCTLIYSCISVVFQVGVSAKIVGNMLSIVTSQSTLVLSSHMGHRHGCHTGC